MPEGFRPYELLDSHAYKAFLEALRADRCHEYPLRDWPAIGAWFHRMQFTNSARRAETLRGWRKRYALPVSRGVRGPGRFDRKPWTTNLMLHAWMATQGRVLSLPRWHPARMAIDGVTSAHKPYSKRPGAMRTRKMWLRREPARLLAARARAAAVAHASAGTPSPARTTPTASESSVRNTGPYIVGTAGDAGTPRLLRRLVPRPTATPRV